MKSVLITGAYGGMGCAAVKHFKEKGYRVFYDDTPGVALYKSVVERISADKSNDCVMDVYCLKDNDSAEDLLECGLKMWLKRKKNKLIII